MHVMDSALVGHSLTPLIRWFEVLFLGYCTSYACMRLECVPGKTSSGLEDVSLSIQTLGRM